MAIGNITSTGIPSGIADFDADAVEAEGRGGGEDEGERRGGGSEGNELLFGPPSNTDAGLRGSAKDRDEALLDITSPDTEKRQKELEGRIEDTGQGLISRARSGEQQRGNFPYQDWNLARNNPRGNLNRASFNDTLRFSRLADRLNNRMHWDPGTASTIMTHNGPVSVGQGTGSVSRWEPITTQEMRQMRANERLDERARNAQVDLQARIQAYPQTLQEAKDTAVLNLTSYMQQMNEQTFRYWQQRVMDSEYSNDWNYMFNKEFQKFLDDQKLNVSSRVLQAMRNLAPDVAAVAVSYFNPSAWMPGSQDALALELMDTIYSLPLSATDRYTIMNSVFHFLSRVAMKQGEDTFVSAATSGIGTGRTETRTEPPTTKRL